MNTPRSHFHRRALVLMAGASAGTACAVHAWGSRAQPSPVATVAASPAAGTPGASPEAGTNDMRANDETMIRLFIGETVLTGRLWNNATARDLIVLLPLTLSFSDFNNLEKLARLPRKLSIDGMPVGDDPIPTDIGYYSPSGDLVVYYDDVGYFDGIVRIGQFDGSVDAIARHTGDFTARIEPLT